MTTYCLQTKIFIFSFFILSLFLHIEKHMIHVLVFILLSNTGSCNKNKISLSLSLIEIGRISCFMKTTVRDVWYNDNVFKIQEVYVYRLKVYLLLVYFVVHYRTFTEYIPIFQPLARIFVRRIGFCSWKKIPFFVFIYSFTWLKCLLFLVLNVLSRFVWFTEMENKLHFGHKILILYNNIKINEENCERSNTKNSMIFQSIQHSWKV